MLFVLFGAGIYLYPQITHQLYGVEVDKQRQIFIEEVQKNEDALEKLYQKLKSENEKLFLEKQKNLTDAFSYEQAAITLKEYGLSQNQIGFLAIPRMQIILPVYLGANEENMKKGAVHLTETSYPIGGENTNCVIAAHRGYSKTAMFRDIEMLEAGDLVYMENFREKLTYIVRECKVIRPDDIETLLIQEGKDTLTLLTCHPYRHNYQRYVVFCEKSNVGKN
ncbi:MAG: class C sortase [Dorea sp.]